MLQTFFSHVMYYTDEGIVHISDTMHRLTGRKKLHRKQPRVGLQKHDFGPPTYSFQAEETQGNYCNSFLVNSVCSNLRAISGVGCSSLQTLFYCLTFNKGNEENVRSYFSRMKDLLINIYFICSYFGFEPSFQRHTTSLSENRIYCIGRAPVKDEITTNETT